MTNIHADAGITFVYWVAAEPTFSLLGICLPAMLPLSRHVMATYFSPLASKVLSALNPRRSSGGSLGSKNWGISASMAENNPRPMEESRGTSSASAVGWDPYLQVNPSLDSQLEMLQATPQHDQYTVDVRGGEAQTDGYYTNVPMRTILVDNLNDPQSTRVV